MSQLTIEPLATRTTDQEKIDRARERLKRVKRFNMGNAKAKSMPLTGLSPSTLGRVAKLQAPCFEVIDITSPFAVPQNMPGYSSSPRKDYRYH